MVLFVVFLGIFRPQLGKGYATHQIAQHLPPGTYARLRALSVVPCGLILRMYPCIAVDLAHDTGSDQWAISVLFGVFLTCHLASFRCFLASYQSVRLGIVDEETWLFPFQP